MILVVANFTTGKEIGTIEANGNRLTGSTPALQEIADSKLRSLGSYAKALAALSKFNNGYLTISPKEGK